MEGLAQKTTLRTTDGGSLPKSAGSIGGAGILRAGFCGLLFLGALMGAALGLRAGLPERTDVPVVSEKLAALAERKRVDTLFIGTSRVFHQLDPQVFDVRMTELGHPTRSYNGGVDGMNFPETFYVLERMLRAAPAIKLVILEAGGLQRRDDALRGHGTLRGLYWRDLARLELLVRAAWHDPAAAAGFREQRLAWLGEQLALTVKNCANLGRGALWLQGRLYETPARTEALRPDGYVPVDRRLSPEEEAKFRATLAARRPRRELSRRDDPEFRAALVRLVAGLRARGVELCFILMPANRNNLPEIPEVVGGRVVALADLDDPVRHPELFRPENYYDSAHLNAAGSPLLTRLTAETVAQHLAGMH